MVLLAPAETAFRVSVPPDDAQGRIAADLDLVRRAQSSDEEAMSFLCGSYYPRVYNFCLSHTRDVPTAEDLASDVMLKMVESIGRYRPSGVPFSAWVFRIARNKLIDQHRHGKRRRRVPLSESLVTPKAGPEVLVERANEDRALYRALNELRPSERDVIILRFIAGLDTRSVASLVGRTQSAVKSLQHRGLKALRRQLSSRFVA
jgi:RNA polymerase sigma-70 factor (ECF subfamily)